MALATSPTSAPVASHSTLRELMLEIRSASMALAASFDSSDDHVSIVRTFSATQLHNRTSGHAWTISIGKVPLGSHRR